MRRALLFMILFNSITFVTNNLAMQEEKTVIEVDDDSDSEYSAPENRPLLPQKSNEKLKIYGERLSKLKTRCGCLLKEYCPSFSRCLCCAGLTGAIIATLVAPPTLSITLGAESRDGINGMAEIASPITAYPTNVTEKPDCTYKWHDDFYYPSKMECMQGSCDVTYEYPPGCAPSELRSRRGRGGYGRGGGRSCGRGGKMRRVRCSIERCKDAEKFEKECTKARDCGCAQMITVPIAWFVSSVTSYCLGRKSKSKDE